MLPPDFIKKILPGAQACHRATSVPASITIAQAALESGWGERAPGNNLFGIKADAGWKGATVSFPTREVINGKSVSLTLKSALIRTGRGRWSITPPSSMTTRATTNASPKAPGRDGRARWP
jgi:flagellar protein FlgJ